MYSFIRKKVVPFVGVVLLSSSLLAETVLPSLLGDSPSITSGTHHTCVTATPVPTPTTPPTFTPYPTPTNSPPVGGGSVPVGLNLSASATWGGYGIFNANDANASSFWLNNSSSAEIVIGLGGTRTISRVTYTPKEHNGFNYRGNFNSWRMYDDTGAQVASDSWGVTVGDNHITFSPPIETSSLVWRIDSTHDYGGESWISAAEIWVWEDVPLTFPSTSVPIATNTMSPTDTSVPTETPFYEEGQFYIGQPIPLGNFEVTLLGFDRESDGNILLNWKVVNYRADNQIMPISQFAFIRQSGDERNDWYHKDVVNNRHGKTAVSDSEFTLMALNEEREYWTGHDTPTGAINEVGFEIAHGTDDGGRYVWFLLEPDPDPCFHGHVPGASAPPPTESSVREGGGGSPIVEGGGGGAINPVSTGGTAIRGFQCSKFYTGIRAIGFDCDGDGVPEGEDTAWWFHDAIDLVADNGTLMVAPITGVVTDVTFFPRSWGSDCSSDTVAPWSNFANEDPRYGFGFFLIIEGNGQSHTLAHTTGYVYLPDGTRIRSWSAKSVDPADGTVSYTMNPSVISGMIGQTYSQGQDLTELGNTGCSTEPHVHWRCKIGGKSVDPLDC